MDISFRFQSGRKQERTVNSSGYEINQSGFTK
jgi:hypothetical protein